MSHSNGSDPSQKQAFQERLARLGHAPDRPAAVMQAAPAPRQRPSEPVKLNDWRENIKYPLSFVGAFLIGMVSVFIARFVRFHTTGGGLTDELGGELFLILDGAMALAIGFALRMAFNIHGKEHVMAKTAGILALGTTMHNLVHMQPELWAAMFSPEWVEEVTYFTDPNTIIFRGYSFEF